ncbi:MAG: hypothetical protein K5931_00525 [Lachnospiraceae bacterium]|nr:hypothetical protein [Lachnospiraceae bacterium]
MKKRKLLAFLTTIGLTVSMVACSGSAAKDSQTAPTPSSSLETDSKEEGQSEADQDKESDPAKKTSSLEATSQETRAMIEETLDISNNKDLTWSYDQDSDAWVMSVVTAVVYPEIEEEEGVSVCVPGAYIKGIDTDGDAIEDVTADSYSSEINGQLVIDYDTKITSSNGQVYTASTAPVILNTGAAGYSSSSSTKASSSHAKDGYINVSCGNRGKNDTASDSDGNEYYTGDAPSCLVDQKAATRFVKYNILLGNLPGNTDYFVSTGGSGGGAHATMFAASSDSPDFYDYQVAVGSVGVYVNEDGSYDTSVTIADKSYDLSDGAWGAVAYSPITSLYEADMAMAFEYYMDSDYDFNTSFQKQVAKYLSEEYMTYINDQKLSVNEAQISLDINGDGDTEDLIDLSIEYDESKYPDTNGYGGTYVDLYLAEFISNLQWYVDNLDYADGWTWFNKDGNALSDEEVASMTLEDKAAAFIEGRYAKGSQSQGKGGPGGNGGPMGNGGPDGNGAPMGNGGPDAKGGPGGNGAPDANTATDSDTATGADSSKNERSFENQDIAANSTGDTMDVGTPDAGTTQSSGSSTDSSDYSSYEEMLTAYQNDIKGVYDGDQYGNVIVELYNPLNYIGAEEGSDPVWIRMVCGTSEGDISMFNSLNLQLAFLSAGVNATTEWQWDGRHVPSEIFGNSLALTVDTMYGEYAGGNKISKAQAEKQTENGDESEASGKDISTWIDYKDTSNISFTLADAVSYRTAGASKSTPGFDVIDYGQEDYVFGDQDSDARHWNKFLLKVFEEHREDLEALFNS